MGFAGRQHEDPVLVWLVRHLAIEHRVDLDAMGGKHVTFLQGFHDAKHGLIGDTEDHDEYAAVLEKRRTWLEEMVGVAEEET